MTKLTREEVVAYLAQVFPQVAGDNAKFRVDAVRPNGATVRLRHDDDHLRPGGTISGPTMMAIADYAMYVALLAQIGPVSLAVTTSFNINFLLKPAPGDLIVECELIKLGKRLAVGDIRIHSEGVDDLVAHATATYSIPADRK